MFILKCGSSIKLFVKTSFTFIHAKSVSWFTKIVFFLCTELMQNAMDAEANLPNILLRQINLLVITKEVSVLGSS